MLPRLLLILTTLLLPPVPATGGAHQSDAALRAALTDYVEGWREGDVERLAGVLAPDGYVMWRSGTGAEEHLETMTFGAILERGSRPQPEYGLDWEILSLEVVDDRLALAKLRISRAGGSYIDGLTLYRIDDRWRIVAKTFVTRSDS